MEKNDKEAATNNETRKHIANVGKFINIIIKHLLKRSVEHDASKLESPELELFTEWTPKLAGCTYGSEEYKKFLEELKPALKHHYDNNRHHPEHNPNGLHAMTLVDLIELFCDWKAATLSTKDGNMSKSIDINVKRFNIDPQLESIFRMTDLLFESEFEHDKP